jgi:hypothetical protein
MADRSSISEGKFRIEEAAKMADSSSISEDKFRIEEAAKWWLTDPSYQKVRSDWGAVSLAHRSEDYSCS